MCQSNAEWAKSGSVIDLTSLALGWFVLGQSIVMQSIMSK